MLLTAIASHPDTHPALLHTLTLRGPRQGHQPYRAALVAHPNLPTSDLHTLLRENRWALAEVLKQPGVSPAQAADLITYTTGPLTRGLIPEHMADDVDDILGTALCARNAGRGTQALLAAAAWAHPDRRAWAGAQLAAQRSLSAAYVSAVARTWVAAPNLRTQIEAVASARPLVRRLSDLTTLVTTRPDDHPTGSRSWLAHPDTKSADIAALLQQQRFAALWMAALRQCADPDHTLATTIVNAAFLADEPLLHIAWDITRPMAVRRQAVLAMARAHTRSRHPQDLSLLAKDHLYDATDLDALIPVADSNLGIALLQIPDTGPQRLAAIYEAFAGDPVSDTAIEMMTACALHPAATATQRRTWWSPLVPTWGTPPAWAEADASSLLLPTLLPRLIAGAVSGGPAAAGRALPATPDPRIAAFTPAPIRAMYGLLAREAVGDVVANPDPAVHDALLALAGTFRGTVGEYLDVATGLAA